LEPIVEALTTADDGTDDDDTEGWDLLQQAARAYYLHDGQLCKQINKRSLTVLPAIEGAFILKDIHEQNGHFGRDLVLAEACRDYLWPGMRQQVDDIIATCGRCRQFGRRFQRLLLKPIIRFRPFQTVAMDYLSMPKGKNGHDTILIAIDLFSKFVLATSLKGPPTTKHTLAMLDRLSHGYMTPEELLTDNGPQFQNRAIADWARTHGTTQTFSAPYAHVGAAENTNHLVLERLRRLCNLDVNAIPTIASDNATVSWVTALPAAVSHLNDRKAKYLAGLSPRQVLFGLDSSAWTGSDGSIPLRLVQMEADRLDVTIAYTDEQTRRKNHQLEHNTYYPTEGDLVAVYHSAGDRTYSTAEKLRPKWKGPYRVTSVGRRSVLLEHLNGLPREGKVGWARLKPWV
jgi:hypothetical protein